MLYDVQTSWRVRNSAGAVERMFEKQVRIEKAVGRLCDFSGFGFGEREIGWTVKSEKDARKIATAIRKLKMRASISKQED